MNPSIRQPSVLVTGASTGIGRACVDTLVRNNFFVLANVRTQKDAQRIEEVHAGKVHCLIFDLTDQAALGAAIAGLDRELGDAGLFGLVNNAGVALSGPLEFIPLEAFAQQLAVNVTGQLAMIQACLPLLRKARGRIVNMSSISGIVAMPMMGPYAASKHALEAISDALRVEVAHTGVRVIVIEPGSVKTPIWEKSLALARSLRDEMGDEAELLYGDIARRAEARASKFGSEGVEASEVAKDVLRALTARTPPTRILTGRGARTMAAFWRLVPERLRDYVIRNNLEKIR